jgi:hypothetical protein
MDHSVVFEIGVITVGVVILVFEIQSLKKKLGECVGLLSTIADNTEPQD